MGYSFFRQLPSGVPGAFRLFANVLGLPEARIQERIEFIRKVNLFSLLTEQQLDAMARIISERWVEDGMTICRQGEFGDELYIVYQGRVQVIRKTKDYEDTLFLAKEGDCLGEMAVLATFLEQPPSVLKEMFISSSSREPIFTPYFANIRRCLFT